jgi:hypothetical protein
MILGGARSNDHQARSGWGVTDINGYHFRMEKLEASRPLVGTRNSRVAANGEDASSQLLWHTLKNH